MALKNVFTVFCYVYSDYLALVWVTAAETLLPRVSTFASTSTAALRQLARGRTGVLATATAASRCDGTAHRCLEALELGLSVICHTAHTASPSDCPAGGEVGRFFVSDAGMTRTMMKHRIDT